ncbi:MULTISPECIES: aminotransferase class IV [unclassified Chelatococcus]|uniref:aminotransferase class IV n=1 Tax=unclassified Chelatococcus TaxID=2638111 RepID=UPI0020BFA03C|nr:MULTISPECIES: aminotransferase class IV [unclassified Chelatococcus]MCO5077675.1 aminotransferase class IV [Chelatococcus sp.]CAH1667080.1 Aminodeoxychorismate lyase [Hyphomicrobiales bacterium]CAH1680070.1 Aminodeoxychorismate lyase [Hyphomicrobiales bacterium]
MLWHDGALHEGGMLTLAAGDRGLLLADGLFETVLIVGGRPWRLMEHLTRLRNSADAIGMPIDTRPEEAILALAAHAAANADLGGLGAVRVTITRGAGPRGLRLPPNPSPCVFATIAPWQPVMAFRPLRLQLAAIRRNEFSPLSRMKSLSYLDNILALEDAVRQGCDDALLLNTRGTVAATSAGNVFALRADLLVTPPIEDGVLPGITRQVVLAAAAGIGLSVREQSLTIAELKAADAAFATNSLRLICPIASLDGEEISRDTRLVTLMEALRAEIHADCGADPFAEPSRASQFL